MIGTICACIVILAQPAASQSTPKGLHVSTDNFTGDRIAATEYGRLNSRSGCGRTDIAIVLERHKGRGSVTDFLNYQWLKNDDPFAGRGYYLNGMTAFLNIGGEILELARAPQSPNLGGSGSTKEESGGFVLPDGVLEKIAATPGVKLRIVGTDHTCDGTFDPNITERAALLVNHLPRPASADSSGRDN